VAEENGEGLLNLKDLLTMSAPSGPVDLSGFVLKRGEPTLLIPRWLLAKFRREQAKACSISRTCQPPFRRGLFENEAVLRRPFGKSWQILPIFTKIEQRTGSNSALNRGFSRPIY